MKQTKDGCSSAFIYTIIVDVISLVSAVWIFLDFCLWATLGGNNARFSVLEMRFLWGPVSVWWCLSTGHSSGRFSRRISYTSISTLLQWLPDYLEILKAHVTVFIACSHALWQMKVKFEWEYRESLASHRGWYFASEIRRARVSEWVSLSISVTSLANRLPVSHQQCCHQSHTALCPAGPPQARGIFFFTRFIDLPQRRLWLVFWSHVLIPEQALTSLSWCTANEFLCTPI